MMAEGLEERGGKATWPTLRAPVVVTLAVLVAFAAGRLAIIGVPSEREYDEGVYLLSARAVLAGHDLFSSVFSSQPPAFLETLAFAMRLFGDSIETGRLLILGFALVALAAVASLARRLAGAWAAPAAAAALALTTTFGDLAHVVEAEMPALAIALMALCACLEARRRAWHRGWLLASGALLALGMLFKLLVAPLAAPLGLLLLLAPAPRDEAEWRLDGRGPGLLGRVAVRALVVAAGAVAVALLPLLFYDARALYEQTIAFHVTKREVYGARPAENLLRVAGHLRANAALAATALVGGALLALRSRVVLLWLMTWVFVMLAIITLQSPLFWRHLVLLSPPLALAAGVTAPLLAGQLRRPGPMIFTTTVIAFWTAATLMGQGRRSDAVFPLFPGSIGRDQGEVLLENVARWIRDHTEPAELVVGDDPIVIYLAGRQAPPALCDTSTARIVSKSLTLEEATRESSAARVIVLRQGGRLSRMPGYLEWLGGHYEKQSPRETGLSERRSVWIRKASASPGAGASVAH